MTRRTRYGIDLAAIAVVYFALARLGLLFTLPGTNVSLVWLPAGVALAALFLFGTSRWPSIALGELALMVSLGYGLGVGIVAAVANAAQALLGTYLLRHVVRLDQGLGRQRDVLGLLAAALVSAAVGATIAVVGFGAIGQFPWQAVAGVGRSWWLGDVVGIALVTPVALTWRTRPRLSGQRHRVIEASALVVVLLITCAAIFIGIPGPAEPVRILPYATFPLLVWSGLRFQQRGAASAVLLLAGFAVWGTAHGYGPLVRATPTASLLDLDAFLIVAAMTTLLLAAGVAERERAAGTLRESEKGASAERERFRALVERGSDIIAMTDRESRLLYVSPSVTQVLGYRPEELIGKLGLAMVHPDDIASAKAHLAEVLLRPGGSVTQTQRVQHQDGTWRHFEVERVNRLDEPSVGALVTNLRDRTEHKKLEEQLLASQRLEAVGRLAGGVAHDFNNILTAILGHTELLREVVPAEGPAAEELREIGTAAARATALTQQLLAFSRRQILQPTVLDVNALVFELDKMLRRLIGEDVTLAATLDPAVDRVRADRGQLEQAIVNLVINARDAMPEGGRVTLATANVELAMQNGTTETPTRGPGRYVMLSVTDTGVGIDEQVRAHLFEPFFTTKEHGKGTGLGLATVYGMVRQSGGHVTVESEPGRGSTFRVYLPALREAADLTPARSVPAARTGTETILLVEDDPSVRSVARRILARLGYAVLEAGDGAAALEQARSREGRIDLLLTDIIMPGMSGRRVAEEFAFLRPDAKLLFMSGYIDDAIVRHGVLDAGIPFLQKPFTVEELAGKVREVLDS